MAELLEMNHKTKEFGLTLTPDQVQNMVAVRNKVLHDYGRVELGIEVTKELMEVFCTSPYINADNYASTLNELHEIFYYLRNETQDQIGDFKLIQIMKDSFDNECAGSLDLLKSKLEGFAEDVRREALLRESLFEGDE
ncbi:DUF6323 family protein [Paludifilum halophilum]|uniref:DUF6323 family protein n=1 Tax=Paludifilum halophilum TaxID=1642702 RepID=UPI001F0A276B|nr:DUF6323 family protein [Paludifilum halophilum]